MCTSSRSIPSWANNAAVSPSVKASSAARISVITPARRNRSNGHGGLRRVVTTNRSPAGGRCTSRSRLSWTASEVISCRLSRTRMIGVASSPRTAAIRPGRASTSSCDHAPEVRGRLVADDRDGRGRDRRPQCTHVVVCGAERHPRCGPACSGLGQPRTHQQRFPQPAGAAISAQQDGRPVVNRLCNRGRGTRCVASGTANLPSQSVARPPPLLILPE